MVSFAPSVITTNRQLDMLRIFMSQTFCLIAWQGHLIRFHQKKSMLIKRLNVCYSNNCPVLIYTKSHYPSVQLYWIHVTGLLQPGYFFKKLSLSANSYSDSQGVTR